MKNSTAAKIKQIPDDYLMAGVDPHKRKHAAVAMTRDAEIRAKFKFFNSKGGFQAFVERMALETAKSGSSGFIVSIETGSHYWRNFAYFLDQRGIPFRLVSPFTLKRRRDGEDINLNKHDFRDGEMAAELLRTGKYQDTKLPYGVYAELRAAWANYCHLRKESNAYICRLKALLDGLFPEFVLVFKNPCGKAALTVLTLGLTPQAIAAIAIEPFIQLVRSKFQGRGLATKKIRALHTLAGDTAGITAGAIQVATDISLLAERICLNQAQLEKMEKILIELVDSTEETPYLLSIPGLGRITIAGLLAELGPFAWFSNAGQLIKMAGTNPIHSESGGRAGSRTPMSKKGRAGLRHCLWIAAIHLLRYNEEFRRWARDRRERPAQNHPLEKREVIGAACNKLLRVAYRLVTSREYYRAPEPAGATF